MTDERTKGFICYGSGSSTYNVASICSAHQVYCCCFCWKTVLMLLTASKQPWTGVQHGTIRPPSCPNLLLGHQKASVLITAITLIGLTLWANIPAIRYTSKHDCKHAPWHCVNMLANWRNVKWDSSKDCLLPQTERKNLVLVGVFTLSLQTRFVLYTQRAISDLAGPGGSSACDGWSTKSPSTLLTFTFWRCLQMENWELLSRTARWEETGFSITDSHITTWRITCVRLSRCEAGSALFE